ncbi:hypothetical protein V6N11_058877 [Hibiscus sabdariffa]|uniref:Uncharacterized protein n=1 Tax=Hibiscus sabdariffa TaxID=183260 RepID=A0ABR2U5R9_9ROSI
MLAPPRPLRVADMVTESGAWDWECLGAMLPREKLDLIASIQPPQSDFGVDTTDVREPFFSLPFVAGCAKFCLVLRKRWGMDDPIRNYVLAPLETSVPVAVRPRDFIAKGGHGLSIDHTTFALAPVDIASLVEKEHQDSYPISVMPLTIEQEMPFDPGG